MKETEWHYICTNCFEVEDAPVKKCWSCGNKEVVSVPVEDSKMYRGLDKDGFN